MRFSRALIIGLPSLLLLAAAGSVSAQTASPGQQACLAMLHLDADLVADAQGRKGLRCAKAALRGRLEGTAAACLVDESDARDHVVRMKQRSVSHDVGGSDDRCTDLPSFGYADAATLNAGAQAGVLDLVDDLFGFDLDTALTPCADDKAACLCQEAVLKNARKIAGAKLNVFRRCVRQALKNGATSAGDLERCVDDPDLPASVAADTAGRIGRHIAGLERTVARRCDAAGVTDGAFPGTCDGLTGVAFVACVDARVECRVCETLNEAAGLAVDCDLFDDAVANGSCGGVIDF